MTDWRDDALCTQVDPETFFPPSRVSNADALRVCALCDVRAECLEWALENDERFGVWGGMSERARQRLRKGRG